MLLNLMVVCRIFEQINTKMAKKKAGIKAEWLILPGLAVGVVLFSAFQFARNPIGAILKTMRIRGKDAWGNGQFGASRASNTRKHEGIDFMCMPGETVFSPFAGSITRFSNPYPDDSRFGGILIQGAQYAVKIFYLSPLVAVGEKVHRGQPIGTAQDISRKYPGITQHVHVEVYENGNLIDPSNLIQYRV
jgi:murein DD-endopeptidase MepM/ murein hydrolase activator NlpD